jgi:hypothetical protein
MKTVSASAAVLLFALSAKAQDVIYSGTGFGTYYYDVEEVQACGTDFSNQNLGDVECNLQTGLTLDQINSDYLVAMNHTQLVGDMALYCGRKVIVTVNGVTSDLPLFIGDGCQRCGTGSSTSTVWNPTGAPGLDFSYSVLSQLNSEACDAGHIDISWQITNESKSSLSQPSYTLNIRSRLTYTRLALYDFDTNAPGQPTGPVNN